MYYLSFTENFTNKKTTQIPYKYTNNTNLRINKKSTYLDIITMSYTTIKKQHI